MVFFFNEPAPTEIYSLSLHDALPILLNGTAYVGNGTNGAVGGIGFSGSQTLSGSGVVVFGNANASCNALRLVSDGTTLTIGPFITVRGHSGQIGYARNCWGLPSDVNVVNQGTISADVAGGTIAVLAQLVTNVGAAEVKTRVTFVLPGHWSNADTNRETNGTLTLDGTFE